MNVLSRIGSFSGPGALRKALTALAFVAPVFLQAQTITFQTNGIVSLTGGPPIYNGQYVLKETDFGFLWLNTATLEPGHVQAESKCNGYQPPSDSGLYVIGDCNGITNISSSGNVVLVRQFNGQCGAMTFGCGGPRDDGHSRLTFVLGTFNYIGDGGEILDSNQTADPQGRTWTAQPVDGGGRNFIWQSSGLPNVPPTAAALGTNLSAADRSDKSNYYGDKWQLQDTSSSGPTSVTWDFNYVGSFAADETGSKAAEGTVIGYFPCDPSSFPAGNIRSGASCMQSLGLSNPPATGNYRFALRSANSFGPSANTFTSAAQQVACPQATIAGYSGFSGTCMKSGGTLSVLEGGNADASASKGNLGEASFSWTFSFPSGPASFFSGQVVGVPNGANGFALAIAFPGGYQAGASGAVAITQTPFVAAFSAPGSVVRGTSFTLVNQMQKGPNTAVNSVDLLFNPGPCGSPPTIPPNPLPASFLTSGGSTTVTAPNAVGNYCIYLKYTYTPPGSPPTTQIASSPLALTNWTPIPAVGVYRDAGRTQPVQFVGGTFYLATGTPYYLFDEEPPPPSGVPYPGAQWTLVSPGSADAALGSTPGQTPLSASFPTVCPSGCFLKVVVGGQTRQVPVSITCVPDATTLCVNSGRFQVQVVWTTTDLRSGAGQAVPLTGDTGYFWFFSPNNVEMIVKVVDGRAVNSAFWVFAGGLTDVDVVITVRDTKTGASKVYRNVQGTPFQPIQDTSAFVVASSTAPDPEGADPAGVTEAPGPARWQAPPGEEVACVSNATTLCLNKSRFKVQTQWTTSDLRTGAGQAIGLTGETGYFWFFSPNNVEMILKVVDGCVFNSSYWVFTGGMTNVNVVTTITDTQTGAVKTYTSAQGIAFQPVQDTVAFATCP